MMCYCDTHYFTMSNFVLKMVNWRSMEMHLSTINRADCFMVGRKPTPESDPEIIYDIDPESLIVMIEEMEAMGLIELRYYMKGYATVMVPGVE